MSDGFPKINQSSVVQLLPIAIQILTQSQIKDLINNLQDLISNNTSEHVRSDAEALITYLKDKLNKIHPK
jgi:hypothetical protein